MIFSENELKQIAILNILADNLEKNKLKLTAKRIRKFIKEYVEVKKYG